MYHVDIELTDPLNRLEKLNKRSEDDFRKLTILSDDFSTSYQEIQTSYSKLTVNRRIDNSNRLDSNSQLSPAVYQQSNRPIQRPSYLSTKPARISNKILSHFKRERQTQSQIENDIRELVLYLDYLDKSKNSRELICRISEFRSKQARYDEAIMDMLKSLNEYHRSADNYQLGKRRHSAPVNHEEMAGYEVDDFRSDRRAVHQNQSEDEADEEFDEENEDTDDDSTDETDEAVIFIDHLDFLRILFLQELENFNKVDQMMIRQCSELESLCNLIRRDVQSIPNLEELTEKQSQEVADVCRTLDDCGRKASRSKGWINRSVPVRANYNRALIVMQGFLQIPRRLLLENRMHLGTKVHRPRTTSIQELSNDESQDDQNDQDVKCVQVYVQHLDYLRRLISKELENFDQVNDTLRKQYDQLVKMANGFTKDLEEERRDNPRARDQVQINEFKLAETNYRLNLTSFFLKNEAGIRQIYSHLIDRMESFLELHYLLLDSNSKAKIELESIDCKCEKFDLRWLRHPGSPVYNPFHLND